MRVSQFLKQRASNNAVRVEGLGFRVLEVLQQKSLNAVIALSVLLTYREMCLLTFESCNLRSSAGRVGGQKWKLLYHDRVYIGVL